jgi:hypothetical protein
MTLADFCDRYDLGRTTRMRYARLLENVETADLNEALERLVARADSTAPPGPRSIREEAERIRKRRDERHSRPQAPQRANTTDDLRLFALIFGLNRLGVLFDFAMGRWVAPGDANYDIVKRQSFAAPCAQAGPVPTLADSFAAWTRYANGKAAPSPFKAATEAIGRVGVRA